MSSFAAPPPPGDGIKWADLSGALLIVRAIAFETGIKTAFGEADAVRADVTVLDGPQAGTEYLDTLIFPKMLAGQLKGTCGTGQLVLGRLTTGVAKPNQSPPWLLAEATPEDQQLGERYLASRQQQVAQPAPAQQQPAAQQPAPQGQQQPAQQWGQPPAAAQGQPQQQGASVPF